MVFIMTLQLTKTDYNKLSTFHYNPVSLANNQAHVQQLPVSSSDTGFY